MTKYRSLLRNRLVTLFCTAALTHAWAQPGTMRGFADLHNHQFAYLAFGGKSFVGRAYGPMSTALGAGYDMANHGLNHGLDLVGSSLAVRAPLLVPPPYPNDGYPTFQGWPNFIEVDHQKVYQDWLYRAVEGGLRLMVMFAVDSPVLCKTVSNDGRNCDDEMRTIDLQLAAAYGMQEYVDEISGGPGMGWYRIVTTPAQARTIIQQGKLAVVLGIETAHIFNCKTEATCDWTTQLNKYWNLGVRHFFPIHQDVNAFGDPSYFTPDLQKTNDVLVTVSDIVHWFSPYFLYTEPYPQYDRGRRSAHWLTETGKALVRELIRRGGVIDVDHMSDYSFSDTLDLAEQYGYPGITASHAGFNSINNKDQDHEGQLTERELHRIQNVGGMVGLITGQGDLKEVDTYWRPGKHTVSHICGRTTETFAQAYYYAIDHAPSMPIAIGTDFNAPLAQPGPRFGPKQCYMYPGLPYATNRDVSKPKWTGQLVYPFIARGVSSFTKLDRFTSASRTFDYNFDGLANAGLLPDMLADLEALGIAAQDLEPLFNSAEGYVKMWEKAMAARPTTLQVNQGSYVFMRSQDGHLMEWQRQSHTGEWKAFDHGTEQGSLQIEGNPTALYNGAIHVFASSTDNRLIEFYREGPAGPMSVYDLSSGLKAPPVAGSPAAVFNGAVHVYVRGTDNRLLEWSKEMNPSPWSVYDLSNANGSSPIAGNPAVVFNGAMHVYARSADNRLLEWYKEMNSSPWSVYDLSNANGSGPIAGNPAVVFNGAMHVYARSADNRLLEWYKEMNPAPWQAYDLSMAGGAAPIAGDPSVVFNGATQVFARTADGRLLGWYKEMNPSPWQVFDSSSQAGGVSVVADPDALWEPGANTMHIFAMGTQLRLLEFFKEPNPRTAPDLRSGKRGTPVADLLTDGTFPPKKPFEYVRTCARRPQPFSSDPRS